MQVLPAGDVAAKLLQSPAQLSLLCSSLRQCFAFDQAAAGLLLYAGDDAGPHLSIPAAQPKMASLEDLHSGSTPGREVPEAPSAVIQSRGQSVPAKQEATAQGSLSAPMLPRMPAGLAHVGSQQCYEALAAVARSIGHVALTAGTYCCKLPNVAASELVEQHGCSIGQFMQVGSSLALLAQTWCACSLKEGFDKDFLASQSPQCAGGSTLRGLVDVLLSNLRRAQRLSKSKTVGRASSSQRPADDWQLQAASIAVVTTEVLFGASPAWQPGPPEPSAGATEQSTAENKQQQEELEALVILVQEEWVREPLWGVPTSEEPSWHQDDSKARRLTPQACCQPRLLLLIVLTIQACIAVCWSLLLLQGLATT